VNGGEARDVGVVIVAGGSSTRTGGRELKQFRWVAGKPVLLHSLQTFMARPDVVGVVVVLPRSHVADPPPWIFQCDVDRLMIAPGGASRSESVWNGLEDLPDAAAVVLVHDAARPLVDNATIDRVVAEARAGRPAIAALPVVDTLKEVDGDGRIVRTVERERLWRAQTPQVFRRDWLEAAHAGAQGIATDDAGLLEAIGRPVRITPSDASNFKITTPADLALAEAWLVSLQARS